MSVPLVMGRQLSGSGPIQYIYLHFSSAFHHFPPPGHVTASTCAPIALLSDNAKFLNTFLRNQVNIKYNISVALEMYSYQKIIFFDILIIAGKFALESEKGIHFFTTKSVKLRPLRKSA